MAGISHFPSVLSKSKASKWRKSGKLLAPADIFPNLPKKYPSLGGSTAGIERILTKSSCVKLYI